MSRQKVTSILALFVIDAKTNQRVATIAPGGGAGNSQYDSGADRIFVTVDGREELAEIDPDTDQIVARYPLTGCKGSHGLLIDSERRLAFAACEDNSRLVVFDLETKEATATLSVGADPDLLAFDPGFQRLYVSAESGVITIFDERDRPCCESRLLLINSLRCGAEVLQMAINKT